MAMCAARRAGVVSIVAVIVALRATGCATMIKAILHATQMPARLARVVSVIAFEVSFLAAERGVVVKRVAVQVPREAAGRVRMTSIVAVVVPFRTAGCAAVIKAIFHAH